MTTVLRKNSFLLNVCCLVCLSSSFIITSCNYSKDVNSDVEFNQIDSEILMQDISIELDTIELQNQYSGKGIVAVENDSIFLIDELFKKIVLVDLKDNKVISAIEFMDVLPSASIFNQSIFFKKVPSGYVLMNGRKLTYFHKNLRYDTTVRINFSNSFSLNNTFENPDPSSMNIYEVEYINKQHAFIDDKVLVNVTSEHPEFNPYTSLAFFKHATAFGLLDIQSNYFKNSKIPKSKAYLDTCCYSIYDWSSAAYDFKNKQLFVQFPIDSFIYVYDNSLKPIMKFGISNGLQLFASPTSTLDVAFDNNLYQDFQSRSKVFSQVIYLDSLGLLVRNYINYPSKQQFIQVYSGTKLVQQLTIPYDFTISASNSNSIVCKTNQSNLLCIIRIKRY